MSCNVSENIQRTVFSTKHSYNLQAFLSPLSSKRSSLLSLEGNVSRDPIHHIYDLLVCKSGFHDTFQIDLCIVTSEKPHHERIKTVKPYLSILFFP